MAMVLDDDILLRLTPEAMAALGHALSENPTQLLIAKAAWSTWVRALPEGICGFRFFYRTR